MDFQQKVSIDFQFGHYRVRTISSGEDLQQVLDLRKACFPALKQSDLQFDLAADHLVVEDQNTQLLCGTYRVSASRFSSIYQTQEDFEIQEFLDLPEAKAELAWACIHPEYRDGSVIMLLWRGLISYLKQIDVKYVFGTTSVDELGPARLSRIQNVLQENNCVYKTFPVKPVSPKVECETLEISEMRREKRSLRLLPGLLRAYIIAGAFVCASPNFDYDLNCYDFMTIFDMDQSSQQIVDHFGKC